MIVRVIKIASIFCVGAFFIEQNIATARTSSNFESNVIGDWRSNIISLTDGLFKRRYKFNFNVDTSCTMQIDEQVTSPFGNASYRVDFGCHYQVFENGKIDILIEDRFMTMTDQMATDSCNKNHCCGQGEWILGQKKDISSADCENDVTIKVGDTIKDLYELRSNGKYLQNLARDDRTHEPDVERDSEGRPLKISEKVGLATKGVMPPPVVVTPEIPDLLSGVYDVIDYAVSKDSCEGPLEPVPTDTKYIYFHPAKVVFPALPGWFSKDCRSHDGCAKPEGFFGQSNWSVLTMPEANKIWLGDRDTLMSQGQFCLGTRNSVILERNEAGEVLGKAREFQIRVPQVPSDQIQDRCPMSHPSIQEAFKNATCAKVKSIRLRPHQSMIHE
ncbi:MAG: hypothetical protein NT027_14150 [Proteobacteria bacterium]|nr:hypothetical protein [Pseudomonadota bacterium]